MPQFLFYCRLVTDLLHTPLDYIWIQNWAPHLRSKPSSDFTKNKNDCSCYSALVVQAADYSTWYFIRTKSSFFSTSCRETHSFISNNTVFDLMKRANLLKAGLEKWTLSANTKVSHTALNYFTKRNPDIEKVDMFWDIKKYQKKRFSRRYLSVPILIVTNKWKLIVWVNNKEKAHRFRCEQSLSDSNALLAPMYHNLDCPAVLDSKWLN